MIWGVPPIYGNPHISIVYSSWQFGLQTNSQLGRVPRCRYIPSNCCGPATAHTNSRTFLGNSRTSITSPAKGIEISYYENRRETKTCVSWKQHEKTNRRKFRSQTSDNMQRWKSRGGKSQRGEVKKWEDQRRERLGSKKMQVREKVGKSRFIVFFLLFVAPECRKVTSLKRRVRSQLARWEMKNCTPLQREAHFQVKMYKKHHAQTTFWHSDVEKVRAVVARSTFQVKMYKAHHSQTTFWRSDVEKVHPHWRETHFQVKSVKKTGRFWAFFDVKMSKK